MLQRDMNLSKEIIFDPTRSQPFIICQINIL